MDEPSEKGQIQLVKSTNSRYWLLATFWLILGFLFLSSGLYLNASGLSPLIEIRWFMNGIVWFGAIIFGGALFFFWDGARVHRSPFPKGSLCASDQNQFAYDWCAICGRLECLEHLVRIKQTMTSSVGMFAFDGVACQDCARRRIRNFWVLYIILSVFAIGLCLTVPLLVLVSVLVWAFLVVLGLWANRRLNRILNTPLSVIPKEQRSIESRLFDPNKLI
ncbi:MAG: hypothetical protein ACFE89_11410 [Candidatus Hodarchaeota archaeon]